MKEITNISEILKPGTKFWKLEGDNFIEYEYLCIHPHHSGYILAIEEISKNAKKLYKTLIENEINLGGIWFTGKYDSIFVLNKRKEVLEKLIENIEKQIDWEENRRKNKTSN